MRQLQRFFLIAFGNGITALGKKLAVWQSEAHSYAVVERDQL